MNPLKHHSKTSRLSWLLLLLVVSACSRCGKDAARDSALSHVPSDAEAVAWVPELGALSEKLMALKRLELLDFVAPILRARDGDALVDSLLTQAGIDARTREGLREAGLDPAGDLAVALVGTRATLLVVPVADDARFEATLTRVADSLFAAGELSRSKEEGLEVVRFTSPGSTDARLAFVRVGRHAVLANGADVEQLVSWASVKDATAMQANAVFGASRERLGGKPVAWVFARGGGQWIPQGTVEGATVALELELTALTARLDVPWPDAKTGIAALVSGKGPDAKLSLLPGKAFAVSQYSGDLSKLGELWPWLTGQDVARAAAQVGLDVQKELLDNVKPGAVMAFSLSDGARMDLVPKLSPRLNPFSWTQVVTLAEVKDPALASQTIAKVAKLSPRYGLRMTPTEWDGHPVWLSSWIAGEGMHVALVEDTLIAAAPESTLRASMRTVKQETKGMRPLDDAFLPLFKDHAFAGVFDLHRLADAVRALPSEAWGIGGFALKPTTVRWLDALEELRAVTLTVDAKGQALQAELSLVLQVEAPR